MLQPVRERLDPSGELALPAPMVTAVEELVGRLSRNFFNVRPANRTRHADGEISLHFGERLETGSIQIRLNSYAEKRCGVINIAMSPERMVVEGILLRGAGMGGDSREFVFIPQFATEIDMPLIENILFGACKCVARGMVAKDDRSSPSTSGFAIYLPARDPMPYFDGKFEVRRLESLY